MSASSTPTSVSCGKLWPLATSCVPITMSTSPAATAASSLRSRSAPPGKSLESTMQRFSGNSSATSSAMRSTPGPQATSVSNVPQAGAGLGRRSAWPQWWHTSAPAKAVLHQPGRAVGALEAMAAGAAERQRRVAAPVEEQQRLLAGRQRRRPWRRPASATATVPRGSASRLQIDRADVGHCRPPNRSGRLSAGNGRARH